MRDIGHEVAAHGLNRFETGNVATQHKLLLVAERHELDREQRGSIEVASESQYERLGMIRCSQILRKLRRTHQVGDLLAFVLG
jgi:peptidoglycan/xylan/chitin deacetylase (PgdA/CDA1 family)